MVAKSGINGKKVTEENVRAVINEGGSGMPAFVDTQYSFHWARFVIRVAGRTETDSNQRIVMLYCCMEAQ